MATVQAPAPPVEKMPAEKVWPPSQGEWTYADFLRLPDDGWRYEVIRGELHMSPPPREQHQYASVELTLAIGNFVKARKLGRVYAAPFGVILGDIATPVQPDLVFVSAERIEAVVTEDGLKGAPDLVVEILSPSTWLTDRRTKFEVYQEAGVREYWVVDPKVGTIEVFVLREGEYALLGRWGVGDTARSEVLAGLEIAVAGVFEK